MSSNSVFNGNEKLPNENSRLQPSSEYGRQKQAIEGLLADLPSQVGQHGIAIVRLTKVVSSRIGLVGEWLERLRNGERCVAYNDLIISPLSLNYVISSIMKIINYRRSGIFHLSGESDITYECFLKRFGLHFGLNTTNIIGKASSDKEVRVKPKYSTLSMKYTTRLFDIKPQPLTSVFDDLLVESQHR